MEDKTRKEIIRMALETINSKANPTFVEIQERVKRRYYI